MPCDDPSAGHRCRRSQKAFIEEKTVMPHLSKRALVTLSLVSVAAACNKGDDSDGAAQKAASAHPVVAVPSAAPAPAAPPTATVAAVVPDPGAIGPSYARTELDGKEPDAGWTGGALSVSKLSFVTPTGWSKKGGDFESVSASDGSAGVAAGKYPDGAQGEGLRDAAAKAMGVIECSWGTSETIGLGKDKLPAQVADGTCKRDGRVQKALFVATSGKDLNVVAVGAWDEGKDSKAVLNTLRSAKGAGGGAGGDASGIAACCAAIEQNMKSAPPNLLFFYTAAKGACYQAKNSPEGRQALATVRAALGAAGVPAACK